MPESLMALFLVLQKGTEIYNAGIILETFFKELLVMYNLSDNKLSEENGILCDTRPRKRLRTSTSGNLSNDKECDPQYTT